MDKAALGVRKHLGTASSQAAVKIGKVAGKVDKKAAPVTPVQRARSPSSSSASGMPVKVIRAPAARLTCRKR